jgi:hypothetical protein
VANRGGRKGKGQHRVAYYPDARIDEPALPVASRAQKSAMFAMCVLIPVVTAATCALFSRGSPKPTFAPAAPQCVIQLARCIARLGLTAVPRGAQSIQRPDSRAAASD